MLTLIFNDIKPISINKLYVNLRGQSRRFMSIEGKKFKSSIEQSVEKQVAALQSIPYLSSLVGKRLQVTIKITSPSWLLKDKKTIRIKDLSSAEKVINDSVFSAINILGVTLDDSQIWSLNMSKEVGETEQISYTISEYV